MNMAEKNLDLVSGAKIPKALNEVKSPFDELFTLNTFDLMESETSERTMEASFAYSEGLRDRQSRSNLLPPSWKLKNLTP